MFPKQKTDQALLDQVKHRPPSGISIKPRVDEIIKGVHIMDIAFTTLTLIQESSHTEVSHQSPKLCRTPSMSGEDVL